MHISDYIIVFAFFAIILFNFLVSEDKKKNKEMDNNKPKFKTSEILVKGETKLEKGEYNKLKIPQEFGLYGEHSPNLYKDYWAKVLECKVSYMENLNVNDWYFLEEEQKLEEYKYNEWFSRLHFKEGATTPDVGTYNFKIKNLSLEEGKFALSDELLDKYSGHTFLDWWNNDDLDISGHKLYNVKEDKIYDLSKEDIVYLYLMLHQDRLIDEKYEKLHKEELRIEEKKYKIKNRVRDETAKEVLDKLSFNISDIENLNLDNLSDDFKDDLKHLKNAMDNLEKYDMLGKEIFKIADIKIGEKQDDEEV